jgi:hypothetical protein
MWNSSVGVPVTGTRSPCHELKKSGSPQPYMLMFHLSGVLKKVSIMSISDWPPVVLVPTSQRAWCPPPPAFEFFARTSKYPYLVE